MELLTVKEVAELLKCNVNFVHKLRNAGLLKFIKIGSLKCRKDTLNEFLKNYDGMDISDPFNVREL